MASQRIFISHRAFILLSLLCLLGIGTLVFPTFFYTYIGGCILSFVLFTADFLSLPRKLHYKVKVEVPKQAQLGNEVSCKYEIIHLDSIALDGPSSIELIAPSEKHVRWNSPKIDLKGFPLRSGKSFVGELTGVAHRLGFTAHNPIAWLTTSSFGLWIQKIRTEGENQNFRIVPAVKHIPEETFSKMVKHSKMLSQSRKVLLRSHSEDQFRSLREFRYPDSIRRIDPKKSAKYMRLMTRTYDSFHSHHLIIVLDLGRAMNGTIAGSKKQDYYLSVILSLVQSAIGKGDQVSFIALADKVLWSTRRAKSMKAFQPLFTGDTLFQARDTETRYDLLPSFIRKIESKRAMVLFFSDLTTSGAQDSIKAVIPTITKNHLFLSLSLF